MDWRTGRPWLRRAAALAALWLTGCGGGAGRTDKEPVSGLWVAPGQIAQLDDALLARLAQANVKELYVPLAELDLGGESPLERRPVPELAPGSRVVVVVGGELDLEGRDLDETARGVLDGLEQLFFGLESRGLAPAGVHFDLSALDSLEHGRAFMKKVRSELGSGAYLSLTLPRAWMDDPAMPALARSVDFVVPFLYGQRESDADANELWDFEAARRRLAQLEEARLSYMVGVAGVGKATHVDRQGRVKATTTQQALSPFMRNRHLELKRGFSLGATNIRLYTLVAQQATRAGGWQIQAKDEVRLVRPMTADVDELLALMAQGEYRGLLGQLFYRLPSPEERLSIPMDSLLAALGPEPALPDIDFDVQVTRRTRQGALYRFVVTSSNPEPTEYSPLNNYLQVTADPDAFGSVDAGDFYRYDLLRLKADGTGERALRNANALRLDLPILEGPQRVESGDVEIRRRNPTLLLEAKFMMPDGQIRDFGPFTWKDGEFLGRDEGEAEDGGTAAADAG